MSEQPSDKQELYDRIRASSKDSVILEEMVRLGFWPADGEGPDSLVTELKERTELQAELRALRTEQSRIQDEEAVLQAIRKQRIEAAREKRKETIARREEERKARREDWSRRQKEAITFLGSSASGVLGQTQGQSERLKENKLPVLTDAGSLARAMSLELGQLRFLAYDRKVSSQSHYVRFRLPKKTGGTRLISAPKPRLKSAQHWILENILSCVALHDACHGFVPGRSTVSCAKPHVGQAVVINLDLKDFFPTVTFRRVLGQFKALGYSPELSTLLSLICTEPQVTEVEMDGQSWWIQNGERLLPQGAPTSPALTNILCRGLDKKLTTLCEKAGFQYTRYADDLTFSSQQAEPKDVGQLLRRVRHIIAQEGFQIHPEKTRVLRRGRRQEVTGIVVNDKVNVDRKTLKKFRALLYQIEKDGPKGKSWGSSGGSVLGSALGFANYVLMVNPEKGRPLQKRVKVLCERHGYQHPKKPVPKSKEALASESSPAPPEKKKSWWKRALSKFWHGGT